MTPGKQVNKNQEGRDEYSPFFCLDDNNNLFPFEGTSNEWAEYNAERGKKNIVGQDFHGLSELSTVFTGIDISWAMKMYKTEGQHEGDPEPFESMLFHQSKEVKKWKYSTWQQAQEQHAKVLRKLKLVGIDGF